LMTVKDIWHHSIYLIHPLISRLRVPGNKGIGRRYGAF
jgi:hypothetical protein